MLKGIAVVALMLQSYLVTEEDNKKLISDREVFNWMVTILGCSIRGEEWHGSNFDVIEVITVGLFQPVLLSWLKVRCVFLHFQS